MLSHSEREKARNLLKDMREGVTLELYYRETEDEIFFGRLRDAVREIAGCSKLIRVSGPFKEDCHLAPSVRIVSSSRQNIRYAALPLGFELVPFLKACTAADGDNSLKDETADYLRGLTRDILIQILVAENCPSCPIMVELACRFAFSSRHVNIEVIDIAHFTSMETESRIRSVPAAIIDRREQIIGVAGERSLLKAIKNAASEEGLIEILASLLTIGNSDKAREIILAQDRPDMLADLLGREEFTVRLGAMVIVEGLLEESPEKVRVLVPGLIELLSSTSMNVRGDAAFVLGKIRDSRAAGPLTRLLSETNEDIVEIAREALSWLEEE
ncbi:MAG: HEAT repeat domain-containing protein [Pseudomonadota bacterium]